MNANHYGSGRSRGSAGSGSFLALGQPVFGSDIDPGYFVYSENYECRRGLRVKACLALV